MKFLYAGDNRNRRNWGCRATSMALGELLLRAGSISGIIDGKEVGHYSMTPVPWGGRFPAPLWKAVDSATSGRWLSRRRQSIKKRLGVRDDFISDSPQASLTRFLGAYRSHEVLSRIMRQMEECDALAINAEGDYIFATPSRRNAAFFNFLILLALTLKKKVFVLNAMFSDCPRSGRNAAMFKTTMGLLEKSDLVSVRDPHSEAMLREANFKGPLRFIPDALFSWADRIPNWSASLRGGQDYFESFGNEGYLPRPLIDLSEPYVCVGGSSSAAWSPKEAVVAYKALVVALRSLGLPILLTPNCDGDDFLKIVGKETGTPCWPITNPIRATAALVGRAAVFISGRFHPSVMAACGGTPSVFLGSNSHKTLSLQHMLEYENPLEYPAIPVEADIHAIVKHAERLLTSGDRAVISGVAARRAIEARTLPTLLV